MPPRPKKPCNYPGCPNLVTAGEKYCEYHRKQIDSDYNRQRGTAHQRGYTAEWRKASKQFLKENPICAECERNGKITRATLVDHRIPHKGDMTLFWDRCNWQPLCASCHGRKTAKEDGRWGR